jgi:hypothetical protein
MAVTDRQARRLGHPGRRSRRTVRGTVAGVVPLRASIHLGLRVGAGQPTKYRTPAATSIAPPAVALASHMRRRSAGMLHLNCLE